MHTVEGRCMMRALIDYATYAVEVPLIELIQLRLLGLIRNRIQFVKNIGVYR